MKKWLKCRVTIFVIIGWAALSVLGYLGKDDIYSAYAANAWETPYFVPVLMGIKDGVFPWTREQSASADGGPETPGMDAAEGTERLESTEDDDSELAEGDGGDNGGNGKGGDGGNAKGDGKDKADGKGGKADGDGKDGEESDSREPRQFVPVGMEYFDDALFIGDSRTVGLHDYGGLDNATFFATIGLNIYDIWDDAFCQVDGRKATLEEALRARQYGKIYLQIGINEMGRGTLDEFMGAYSQTVSKIRELQPDAVIFLEGIMHVARGKSQSDPIFNNPAIIERNDRIRDLADGDHVFYIDMNEAVCDEEGNLKDELTFDQLHLYGSKYYLWVDFLLLRGIEPY